MTKVKCYSTRLLKFVIKESEKNEIWLLQCGIIKDYIESIHLHRTYRFEEIGQIEKIELLSTIFKEYILKLSISNKLINILLRRSLSIKQVHHNCVWQGDD